MSQLPFGGLGAGEVLLLGHHVVLLPPRLVRPYVKGNKTDRTDAKGILEASRNEDIRPVARQEHSTADPDLAMPNAPGVDGGAHRMPQHFPRPTPRAGPLHSGGSEPGRPGCVDLD